MNEAIVEQLRAAGGGRMRNDAIHQMRCAIERQPELPADGFHDGPGAVSPQDSRHAPRRHRAVHRIPLDTRCRRTSFEVLNMHTTGRFEAAASCVRMSVRGRENQFAASGSSRWPDVVAKVVTRRRVLPSPNVKFRGAADSRPRNWPRSGIGARRHSPATSK